MHSGLYSPVSWNGFTLRNRVFMAPMTRSRAGTDGVHASSAALYYAQRAEAGLLISEAAAVCQQGSGYPMIPGLFTPEQEASWCPIFRAVHEKGCTMFVQLFHTGRVGHQSLTGETPVSSSAVALPGTIMTANLERVAAPVPRELSREEIADIVEAFVASARRAMRAGADGVEIHAAHGYLIDQFLRDSVNRRTDLYGGSVENRIRFLRDVVSAVCEAIGSERVGVRISPLGDLYDMRDTDPRGLFVSVCQLLRELRVGYVHLCESPDELGVLEPGEDLTATLREVFGGFLIVNRGYTRERAEAIVETGGADAVAFGVPFLANPDLVTRLRLGAPLNAADPSTFCCPGEKGYTDYPFLTSE